jgi:hypothetical protein
MTVQIAGRGGVPSSGVAAVVVNITSVSPSGAGWLTAYRAGTGVPTGSTLNYGTMSAQANTAVVALSADGKLAIKNNGAATHLLIDVQGFYADTAT